MIYQFLPKESKPTPDLGAFGTDSCRRLILPLRPFVEPASVQSCGVEQARDPTLITSKLRNCFVELS
jgi:hypothetical protein